jgi:hypothetical protein
VYPPINAENKETGTTIGRIIGNRICSRNTSVLISLDGLKNPPKTSAVHGKKIVIKNKESTIEAKIYLFAGLLELFTLLFLRLSYLRRIMSTTIAGNIFNR